MTLCISLRRTSCAVALLLAACNQLEAVEDGGSGGGGGVPPEVRAAFEGSCGLQGCHSAGATAPVLAGADLDNLVGSRYVTIGDIAASYLAVKMLPDEVVAALGVSRTGARMPQTGDFLNPNNQIILAWIAGASFEGGGGTDTDTDTGGTDTDATDTDTTTGMPAEPTFANVQSMIFDKTCSCHLAPPGPANGSLELTSGSAYANIFQVKSTQATGTDLIAPMDPANSYLYLKVTGMQATVPGGGAGNMPLGGMLDESLLMLLEEWINAGALDN
jgi:hypothetical protein